MNENRRTDVGHTFPLFGESNESNAKVKKEEKDDAVDGGQMAAIIMYSRNTKTIFFPSSLER